jgi:predicted nucleic acid-binding Zn ribbon protein
VPIYEYRRPDGSTFELQQSFSEEALTHDPDTGVAVQRVLHAPAVHFKGSGFYNTDYGTRNRQREDKDSETSSKEKSTDGEKSSSSSTESKSGSESKAASEGKSSSSQGSSSSSQGKSSEPKTKATDAK